MVISHSFENWEESIYGLQGWDFIVEGATAALRFEGVLFACRVREKGTV